MYISKFWRWNAFHSISQLRMLSIYRDMWCYYSLCVGNQCLLLNKTLIYHVMFLSLFLYPCVILICGTRARSHVWFLLTEMFKKNIYMYIVYQSSLSISTYEICGVARRRTFSTLYENLKWISEKAIFIENLTHMLHSSYIPSNRWWCWCCCCWCEFLFALFPIHVSKYSRRFPFIVRFARLVIFVTSFPIFFSQSKSLSDFSSWCDTKSFPLVQFISRPSTLLTCHLCNSSPAKNVNFIFLWLPPDRLRNEFSFWTPKRRIASEPKKKISYIIV